ncbi:PadR family transcriptional regulator [Cupriavidus sp. DB3]|uniref:PadR family transcriptional regulator n=1 Tax=Cupriavidus sp. DB3 TaxID=2873259 RepID=UPI001CF2AEE4|nr:PadR family transcriptional regulator [Cupriavidus sp. DB3]MCA7082197.1 PadR family transcriptional regulator [Cupriavidus sp. DB3]
MPPRHHHGRHGHGPGGPFGGFGGFGSDADGLRRGRKLGADDLQLLLLDLLAEQPSHGYELIKALEARSAGFYKPSPGVIYPALTYLEEIGHAAVDVDGNRKCYRLAEPGREFLQANRERLALLWNGLRHAARKMEWVRRALAGEPPPEPDEQGNGWLPEFVQARMALKRALLLRTDASPAEQRRVADILLRAVADIEDTEAAAVPPRPARPRQPR